MQKPDQIDILIPTTNDNSTAHAAISLANSLIDEGLSARLVIIDKERDTPYKISPKVEMKYLGAKPRTSRLGKIIYFFHSAITLKLYLMFETPERLFIWGKEFTALTSCLCKFLCLPTRIIFVNTTNVEAHLKRKGFFARRFFRAVYRRYLGKVHFIIAQSEAMLKGLSKTFRLSKNYIKVIHPPLEKKFLKQAIKEKKKTGEILFVGRLEKNKSPELLLRVFEKLHKKNPTLKLRFVGEGSLHKKLTKQIKKKNLTKNVFFEGHVKDVRPFMKKADALILTSKYADFGIVLAEAIACGTPVVSFDCPVGPSEIIQDDINGYLVPPKNEKKLAEAIEKTIKKKWDVRELRKSIGHLNPDRVIKEYFSTICDVFGLEKIKE
ncbi:MAG: glycosyltransferase [Alphaproteobacteria bacterium]